MVLAWKQPSFIGGADITGYFLDYREVVDGVPEKWHEANTRAVSERAYRVGRSRPRGQTRGVVVGEGFGQTRASSPCPFWPCRCPT